MTFARLGASEQVSAVAALASGIASFSVGSGLTQSDRRRRCRYGSGCVALEIVPEVRGPVRRGKEVLQVHVLHRHGARTPIALLPGMPKPFDEQWHATWGQCRQPPRGLVSGPGSPATSGGGDSLSGEGAPVSTASESAYGPCGKGQLTRLGESQLEQLGAFLRFEYLEVGEGSPLLFGPDDDKLRVRSTKTSRTILSAQALLKGLFPQVPASMLQHLVKQDNADTNLIPQHARCDRFRQITAQERKQIDKGLLSTSTRLRLDAALGASTSAMTFIEAGDPLRSLSGHAQPLPVGVSMELKADLDACGHEIVDCSTGRHNAEMRRLSMGRLLTEMREQIIVAVQGQTAVKCVIRSAHDISVCGILVALGLSVHDWPAFGSSVILELLRVQASGAFEIRIVCYDGPPFPCSKPLIDVTVPLETWESTVAPLMLTQKEYEIECGLPNGMEMPPTHRW